jgi:hypothetical protein
MWAASEAAEMDANSAGGKENAIEMAELQASAATSAMDKGARTFSSLFDLLWKYMRLRSSVKAVSTRAMCQEDAP